MKAITVGALVLGTLGLTGCAASSQVTVHPISTHHYAPTSVVQALTSDPARPYVVIANLHASAPAGTPSAQVIASIEKRAASLGADAVILHNHSRSAPPQVQFNSSGGNYQNVPATVIPDYSGEAIHWVAKGTSSESPSHGQ
ncbi:hypothetical protein HAP94_22695 [Acidithiobacillus ferrivorans]|nr:hypothetical protein [Acidithiobacillus ferrivorans]